MLLGFLALALIEELLEGLPDVFALQVVKYLSLLHGQMAVLEDSKGSSIRGPVVSCIYQYLLQHIDNVCMLNHVQNES